MALIVHKYGGTSMGSIERIRNVAKRVAKWRRAGHRRGGGPVARWRRDQPPARAGQELQPQPDPRELDVIAATGEQVSVGPAGDGAAVEGRGCARSYAGWQVPILTDRAYTKARIVSIDDTRMRADLAAGQGGRRHRLPGRRRRGQHHHARPRRLGHLGGGGGGGDEGRRVPDLHRRRRRLHHRPAHRARGAPAADRQLRGNAGDGQPGLQGAADPLGGVRRQVPGADCACCRASRPVLPLAEEAAPAR